MTPWISIDPGKHTGMVAWRGDRLVAWELAAPPDKASYDEWLPFIVDNVKAFAWKHEARTMAIERPFIDPSRPAPELNALVRSLLTMARRQKLASAVYPQSTVKSRIRPQGCQGMDDKEMLRLGVRLVYGDQLADINDLPQDVIDAIACGHCHLSVTAEARILEERTINA